MYNIALISIFSVSLIAVIYSLILARIIGKKPSGSKKMADIANAISVGVGIYLFRQVKTLGLIVAVVVTALLYLFGWQSAVSFLAGATLCASIAYFGVRISTIANVRSAEAAKENINSVFSLTFKAGISIGLFVAGTGLLSVYALRLIFADTLPLVGFAFGASIVSFFVRLGGGIFSKGADICADLLGKIEARLAEDDPRNPALIPDNVGDNIGDSYGVIADLFGTFTLTLIIPALTSEIFFYNFKNALIYPFAIIALSIVTAIIGFFFVRPNRVHTNHLFVLYRSLFVSLALMLSGGFFVTKYLMTDNGLFPTNNIFYSFAIGLFLAIFIVLLTAYYTSKSFSPVKMMTLGFAGGKTINIIDSMATLLKSTILPAVFVAAAVIGTFHFGGIYGISITVLGMLSLFTAIISIDATAPIFDNGSSIARVADLSDEAKEGMSALDALGNTVKAITKGYGIILSGILAFAIILIYSRNLGDLGKTLDFNLLDPYVFAGLIIGAVLPYIFASISLQAVGRAGARMLAEGRKQLQSSTSAGRDKILADYKKPVDLLSVVATSEAILPTIIVIILPIFVGLVLGPLALGGMLVGAIISGIFLAIIMTNSGGALDNAKKSVEENQNERNLPAVFADVIGDPYKDTAGPTINSLIKILALVALLASSLFIDLYNMEVRLIILGSGVLVFIICLYYYQIVKVAKSIFKFVKDEPKT